MATVAYNPGRGTVSDWGDSNGNRVDRFLACVAYLDGERPSLVMCRGYYTRVTLAALDFRNGSLTLRWFFDSYANGNNVSGSATGTVTVKAVLAYRVPVLCLVPLRFNVAVMYCQAYLQPLAL